MNPNSAINAEAIRTDLIPATVPDLAVMLIAVVSVLLWMVTRHLTLRYRERLPKYSVPALRVVSAVIASWCGLQVLGRVCDLTGTMPIWLGAVMAGGAVEGAAALYMYERQVISKRLGLLLTALRGLALLLLVVILMQPVRVWSTDRHITRRVAVLVDDSESMHFTDHLWTTSELVSMGLHADLVKPSERLLPALNLVPAWSAGVRPWKHMRMQTNAVPPVLSEALETGLNQVRQLQSQVDSLLKKPVDAPQTDMLKRMQKLVRDTVVPAFVDAKKEADAGLLSGAQLSKWSEAVEQIAGLAAATREAVDTYTWNSLPAARQAVIKDFCTTTRFALGSSVLLRESIGGEALLDRLSDRYDVKLMRLGDGLGLLTTESLQEAAGIVVERQADAPKDDAASEGVEAERSTTGAQSLRSLTDYASALETLIKDIPSEEFAGVLVVSDGRNNGEAGLEPIARRYGLQGVPVSGVVVGGSKTPRDVAIAEVLAPESIFLGDRVRMRVTMHVTGAKGSQIKLKMSGMPSADSVVTNALSADGDVVLDETTIKVLTDDYTHEVRMTHEPKEHGLRSYTLETDVLEGELFSTNNTWKVDVAISDDRTNVLLVDDRPRWEFRYLRNLFYGRDKSVHLQSLLLRPDRVEGVTADAPLPPASASRKFGDAEAGSLPTSREEWRKFGMIVIGDVAPDTLTEDVLADIRHCVSERGALLVVIAGRNYMPMGYDDEVLRELLPITYEASSDSGAILSRLRSRLVLTGAGGGHAVMQQSSSYSENAAIWEDMMPLTWRLPVTSVKSGAEILAYAVPVGEMGEDLAAVNVAGASDQLDEENSKRSRNALIVAQDYGRGKVLMLNFDQTWRLRHKAGDTLHHKFWGQVMRWGVGEKLRAGDNELRLGTDKLTYTPLDVPRVLARVTDADSVGVENAVLEVNLMRDGETIASVTPVYREGSHGMYEADLPPCADMGRYDVVMTRTDGESEKQVETAFMVVVAKRSIELADVTSTRVDLENLARLTDGRVVGPDQAGTLWDAFGEGGTVMQERHERTLWDKPWVLFCLAGLLTTEWLLRKRGGLT
jgi:hypothetical protein